MTDLRGQRFTVIIPTAGRISDLRRCLARLAPGAQHLSATEYDVVVSDDSALRSAVPLVRAEFPWARVTHGPRAGPAANRNAGARAGTGAWLAFVDDDCVPDAAWLAALARVAGRERPPDVLEGRTTCAAGLRSARDHAPVNERGGLLWSCNLAVRREAFARLGGFDERFPHPHFEDVDFRERVREHGLRAEFVADAVVDHPPRRLAFGARLGEMHYGELLFAALRARTLTRRDLLWRITRTRLRAVRERPGFDAPLALASWLAECVHVWRRFPAWNRAAAAAARRA
jgi:GT2 family glycosyltransferase